MAKYRLTILAQKDLQKIWYYTANEWSLDQANKYFDGLLLAFQNIADQSVESRPVESIYKGFRRVVLNKHYIFFRNVGDDDVEITRVLHVTMDSKKWLP